MQEIQFTFIPEDHTIILNNTTYISAIITTTEDDKDIKAVQWRPEDKHVEFYSDKYLNLSTSEDYDRYVAKYLPLVDKAKAYEEEQVRKAYGNKAYCAAQIRSYRDFLLESTDKYLVADFPISAEDKVKILDYRKQLRDFPTLAGFPWVGTFTEDAPWPINPMTGKKV